MSREVLDLSVALNRVIVGGQEVKVFTRRAFLDIGQASPINSSYRTCMYAEGEPYFQSGVPALIPADGLGIWYLPIIKHKAIRVMGITGSSATHLVTPTQVRLKQCSFSTLESLLAQASTVASVITQINAFPDFTNNEALTEDNTLKPTEVIYVVTPPAGTTVFEVEIQAYSTL